MDGGWRKGKIDGKTKEKVSQMHINQARGYCKDSREAWWGWRKNIPAERTVCANALWQAHAGHSRRFLRNPL